MSFFAVKWKSAVLLPAALSNWTCPGCGVLLDLESLEESGEITSPTAESIKVYTTQIQDLVIARLNAAISCKLLQLVNVLHDSYTGYLFTIIYCRCCHVIRQRLLSTELSYFLLPLLTYLFQYSVLAHTYLFACVLTYFFIGVLTNPLTYRCVNLHVLMLTYLFTGLHTCVCWPTYVQVS